MWNEAHKGLWLKGWIRLEARFELQQVWKKKNRSSTAKWKCLILNRTEASRLIHYHAGLVQYIHLGPFQSFHRDSVREISTQLSANAFWKCSSAKKSVAFKMLMGWPFGLLPLSQWLLTKAHIDFFVCFSYAIDISRLIICRALRCMRKRITL